MQESPNKNAECNEEDLLSECNPIFKALNIPDASEGHHDKLTIQNAIWRENDKDIKAMLARKKLKTLLKTKDLREST